MRLVKQAGDENSASHGGSVAIIAPRDEPLETGVERFAKPSRANSVKARHADWRATFLDDLTGTRLLHSVISQVREFTADEYYSIASACK